MSLPDQEDACKTNSQMWSLFLVTFSAKFTKLNANSYLRMAGLYDRSNGLSVKSALDSSASNPVEDSKPPMIK